MTIETEGTPTVEQCRYAVLSLAGKRVTYAIYDRVKEQIVDGWYLELDTALEVARARNLSPDSFEDMIPNSSALGLIFPRY